MHQRFYYTKKKKNSTIALSIIAISLLFLEGCISKHKTPPPVFTLKPIEVLFSEHRYRDCIAKGKYQLESSYGLWDKRIKMSLHNNMGPCYDALGEYDSAKKCYINSINAWPERGYYGYLNLASLSYKTGNLSDAIQYSDKAKDLVLSPDYLKNESDSGYNIEFLKKEILASNAFYHLKSNYEHLLSKFRLGSYNDSLELANEIVNQNYYVYLGMSFVGDTIGEIEYGSISELNGLIAGDKILKINDKKIRPSFATTIKLAGRGLDIINALVPYYERYGSDLKLGILRKGREISLKVKLAYPEIEQTKKILRLSQAKLVGHQNNNFRAGELPLFIDETKQKIEIERTSRLYDQKVAVVIGVNKYQNLNPLEFAVRDAQAILEQLKRLGFSKTISLFDDNANRAQIMRFLADDLPILLKENDGLMVYFAGHGLTEELPDGTLEGYIAPVDADDNYKGTAISMSSIHQLLLKYKAKHILFVFDSCYSGLGLQRAGTLSRKSAFIRTASSKKAVQIITAGGKNERSIERGGHGIFTRAVLDEFEHFTVDNNKINYLVASDIAQAVRKKVTQKTNGRQNPVYGWVKGEGDFIFEK